MSMIDIRTHRENVVTYVRFEDEDECGCRATRLRIDGINDIFIEEDDLTYDQSVRLESKEHALNLIKAIEKVIGLGYLM